jgi:hypothetical protein
VDERTSYLLLEEYFSAGDERFLSALREFHVPGRLAQLADRWKNDPRPWAREQILKYLDEPLNAAAHETVVKRLFKHFEAAGDDELMGAFTVAFDRLVRRRVTKRWRYEYRTQQSWYEEWLKTPHNSIPTPSPEARYGPVAPSWKSLSWPKTRSADRLFSHHTRYYLRRRAWRYFRRLGFSQPTRFVPAVARLLRDYRDEDFARGENLLDSWSLLHACFGESDVLEFGASHAKVREGRALRELVPAPHQGELWKDRVAADLLLELLFEAQSRLVRVWATQLVRREHAAHLQNVPVSVIRRMLDHADEELQLLGAELLENAAGLEKLTVAQWLELLGTKNLAVLETICRLMARHIRVDRVSLEQAVALAVSKPAPISRLGFDFLKQRQITAGDDLEAVALLATARSASIGHELALWALKWLSGENAYHVERVARFFDSLTRQVRDGAMEWLEPGAAGWDDPALWSRLIETPYDDIRLGFITLLEQRTTAPGLSASHLTSVWCAVLLGVHRGGRHKLTALRQISDAVRKNPASLEKLLPVLAVAIRSVRVPEARAGLAAIVSAVEARPELADLVARHLPELQLRPEEAST